MAEVIRLMAEITPDVDKLRSTLKSGLQGVGAEAGSSVSREMTRAATDGARAFGSGIADGVRQHLLPALRDSLKANVAAAATSGEESGRSFTTRFKGAASGAALRVLDSGLFRTEGEKGGNAAGSAFATTFRKAVGVGAPKIPDASRDAAIEGRKAGESFASQFKQAMGFGAGLGVAGMAAGAVMGLTNMATAGVKAGLDTAAAMEQANIGFTTMLGSAEKAGSFLHDLSDFAAKTPFEFPELQTAAQSLISVGIDADKVIPIMTQLGNATAGMGTGAEGVKRATVAIQQMTAAQRISGEDLNQLRDAGIPVFELLAKATGKTTAEVAALAQAGKLGKTELDQMMKALESGKGLERFSGMMDKQSQSLSGLMSTMKDTFNMGMAKAIEPLIPTLKQIIGLASQGGEIVMPVFARGLSAVVDVATTVGSALKAVWDLLVQGDFTDTFREMFGVEEDAPVVGTIRTIHDAVKGLWDLLVGGDFTAAFRDAFGVEEDAPIVGTLQTIHAMVSGVIGDLSEGDLSGAISGVLGDEAAAPILATLDKVQTGARDAFGGLVDRAKAAWDSLKGVDFGAVWDRLSGALQTVWRDMQPVLPVLRHIGEVAAEVGRNLVEFLGVAFQRVAEVVKVAVGVIVFLWDRWGGHIMESLTTLWSGVVRNLSAIFDVIAAVVRTALALIKGDWSGAWQGLKDIVSTAFKAVGTTIASAGAYLWSLLKVGLVVLRDGLIGFFGGIGLLAWKALTGAWSAVAGWFSEQGGKLKDAVAGALSSAWSSLSTSVSSGASSAQKAVADFFEPVRRKWSEFVEWSKGIGRTILWGLEMGLKAVAVVSFMLQEPFIKFGQWVGGYLAQFGQMIWGYIKPGIDFIAAKMSAGWAVVHDTVTGWVTKVRTYLDLQWMIIQGKVHEVWSEMARYFSTKWTEIYGAVSGWVDAARRYLEMQWLAIQLKVHEIWFNIARFFAERWIEIHGVAVEWGNKVGGFLSGLWGSIRDKAVDVWDKISTWLKGTWDGLRDHLEGFVRNAESIWNRLKEIAAVPIRFVVNTVLAGLAEHFNDLSSHIDGPTLPVPHVGFAAGGRIPGESPGPGRDNLLGLVAGQFPVALAGREWVLNGAASDYYGDGILGALNQRRISKSALALAAGGLPGLADGGSVWDTVMGAVSGAASSAISTAGSIGATILGALLGPAKDAVAGLIGDIPGAGMVTDLARAGAKKLISSAFGWLSGHDKQAGPSYDSSNTPGAFEDWWKAAMAVAGPGYEQFKGAVAAVARMESGFNPNAINLWDSNAAAGHPSAGLMQFIPDTFAAYQWPGHGQFMSPVDQILAFFRYAEGRYGGVYNVPGLVSMAGGGGYVGYDQGGVIPPGVTNVVNRTGRPEWVLDADQTGALMGFLQSAKTAKARPAPAAAGGGDVVVQGHVFGDPVVFAREIERRRMQNLALAGIGAVG